ncbi:MAG: T9SS type A sorting domain-containing protein [Candidatus Krumholzibacteria bacterium]|nr:T9SS type A sorting domain-containing protein [Candidatus Krumholzibacteria bacterium]MDH4337222.1 T9SS type A sorting domain-containing protein [Candidatus Krumholzibacteria bacterium]MDH5268684.1 T9SS type A sorting domain-containing protein [Candidatus Krumholzibacteria bacterium]
MKRLLTALLCACALSTAVPPAAPHAASHLDGLTLIVVDAPDITALHAARTLVESHGGTVGVMLPPSILLGWVDGTAAASLVGADGIRDIRWTESAPAELGVSDETSIRALDAFNAIVSGRHEQARRAEAAAGGEAPAARVARVADGITRPDLDTHEVLANLGAAGLDEDALAGMGFSPQEALGNSDAMTGTVALTVFLVESDGSGADPDLFTWTLEDMQKYVNSSVDGLLWWVARADGYRDCHVTFMVNYHSAFDPRCQQWVEPSTHNAGFVSTWSSNVMGNFGFNSGSHFSRVTAFNTWQRTTYQTNRAYSAFIAYNPPGGPQSFADGGYAFAWVYGPYFWSLFRTVGWTRDVVVSHETGHIFGACDEYVGGCSSCFEVCDLQNTPNANCEACNPDSRGCMMRSNENALCQYTRGMIGWDAVTPCGPAPPAPLPAPSLSMVSPGGGLVGGETTITLTGANFVAGAQADLGPGVFVHETVLVNSTTLSVWLSVLNATPAGPLDVQVRNPDGQVATLAGAFEVLPTLRHYYAPGGGNQFPYTSPGTAAAVLADAIGAAASGDTVLVPGMTISNFAIVINKGVVLQGAWDPAFTTRDLVAGRTVLDLNGMVDFLNASGGGLDGFILQNGEGRFDVVPFTARFAGAVRVLNSNVSLRNCEIRDSSPQTPTEIGYGGALFAYQSTIVIDDCDIHDNTASRGGAAYLEACTGVISNTTFTDNIGIVTGSANPEGAGLYLVGCSDLAIDNCTISGSVGGQNGGAILAESCTNINVTGGAFQHNSAASGGGAIQFKATTGSITGARIAHNTALLAGGVWLTTGSSGTISQCTIAWNTAAFGGGLLSDAASLNLDHNLFVGNSASAVIGGAGLSGATSGSVIGNTFDRNGAPSSAGGLSLSSCSVPVFNNIVANSTGIGISCSGTPVTYMGSNNVWNSTAADYDACAPGTGTISQDPVFADTSSGDYHLAVNSPCIDRGRPDPAFNDPDGSRGDMGRYGSHAFAMDQPVYPRNVSIESATLRWDANPEPDVIQYAVYCDTLSGFTPGTGNLLAIVAAPDTFLSIGVSDTLCYRVSAVDAFGYGSGYSDEACAGSATAAGGSPRPAVTQLLPNVPNPFNPTTSIRFELAAAGRVRLAVYDVSGAEVVTLVDGVRTPGLHSVAWNGTDRRGARVASGVYFYRLESAAISQTRKMVLLK